MVTPEIPAERFFVSGGTLPLESASYVVRECDRALYSALSESKYCYVLNSRQMGKSSLSIRTLAQLERDGFATVSLDLTQMGGRNVTAEQWYLGLAAELGRNVGLRSEVLAYCRENKDLGPMRRLFGAIREVVLEKIDRPIVVCIDEIDATRNLAFDTDEFFAGIRECFNRRAQDPAFRRLTFCILGVAVPSDLIRDPNTTPFNIGERVYLRDFTLDEVRPLAQALGPSGDALVERVHYWTNGHPFLTQSLCAVIAAQPKIQTPEDVDRLVDREMFGAKARDRNVNLADVANRALNAGAKEPDPERFRADLLSAYGRALQGKPVPDDEGNRVAGLLKLSGLVRSDERRLRVRNRIYERVFDAEWVQENLPGQELLRQQQAFRRGLVRATLFFGGVSAVIAALAVFAWSSQRQAQAATDALNRELYVAAMNNLRVFEQSGDIARISATLEKTRSSPYRGFEWGLWQNRLHDAREEYSLDYFAPGKRESGYISLNRRLICVVDEVLGTATVIDRRRQRVIGTRALQGAEVIPTADGFYSIDRRRQPAPIKDVLSGAPVGQIGRPENRMATVVSRAGSPFMLTRSFLPEATRGEILELWDVRTLRRVASYGGVGQAFFAPLSYSADGRRILFGQFPMSPDPEAPNPQPASVTVRDTATGAVMDAFPLDEHVLFDFSPSGKHIVYTDGPSTTVGRDIDARKEVYRHEWPLGSALVMTRFVDGDRAVASLDQTGRVTLESYPDGKPLGMRTNVWSISATPGSEMMAFATTVRVFDVWKDTGAQIVGEGDRLGRNGQGEFVAFNPGVPGLRILSNPGLAPGAVIPRPKGFKSYTYNGQWQVWEDEKTQAAYFSPTRGGKPVRLPIPPGNFSGSSSDKRVAYLVGPKSEVVVASGTDGRVLWRKHLPELVRSGLWVSPDASMLFLFLDTTTVAVMDAATGRSRGTIERHNLRVANITFTADSQAFFTCGADGRAILWDMRTLRERMQFQGNVAQRIVSADLSPDGRRVVTSDDAGAWQLWDAETGVQLSEVKVSPGPIKGIYFTADGRKIVAACPDGTIRVWRSVEKDPSLRVPVSAFRLESIRR